MIKKIKSKLLKQNIQIIGKEKILVYNSPYKFFNRRNEIIIPINYNINKLDNQINLLKK